MAASTGNGTENGNTIGTNNGGIAKRWRELHGENSWEGLLDPLDLDLRKSIISYGELEGATGDGFNNEKHSRHYGLCVYGRDDLLSKSGAAAAGHYKVTKFVYAMEEKEKEKTPPVWIGYVAAATDAGAAALGRRDVVVAWRGSLTATEWGKDIEFMPASPWPALDLVVAAETITHPLALVHGGFLSLYTAHAAAAAGDDDDDSIVRGSAREQVLEEVKRLMELYKDEETSITVVGHSLGSALAVLNAVDLVGHHVNRSSWISPSCPVTAIVFACPHVGNNFFKDAMESFKDLRVLHVRNDIDPVPKMMKWLPDLGVTLPIDTTLSPYLKDPKKSTAHELECYLHAVAGEVRGDDGEFVLVVDRDVALVNKHADALKDECHVPASWWVVQNKGMVKNDEGKWELKDFVEY